jgi:hypothetical protein
LPSHIVVVLRDPMKICASRLASHLEIPGQLLRAASGVERISAAAESNNRLWVGAYNSAIEQDSVASAAGLRGRQAGRERTRGGGDAGHAIVFTAFV